MTRPLRVLAAAAMVCTVLVPSHALVASAATTTASTTTASATSPPADARPAPDVLSPTPYMGWNTYYGLGGAFDETSVKQVADALVDRGLAAAGYDIVWLDGGWQAGTPRDLAGDLVADPARFPSGLKALTDYLHGKGLRAGIYTDAGPYLPQHCGLGSGGHYQHDADQFAAWGFDAVKVDFLCGIAADLDPRTAFTEFAHALQNNSSHRPMIFNVCNPVTSPYWGSYPPEQQSTYSWTFAPAISQAWRTFTDVGFQGSILFPDVLRNYDANAAHPEVVGPGHFSDPDYLGPELGMSATEFRTQMTLWSVAAAPLVIASDVRTLSAQSVDVLTDPDVLAVDQDPAAVQGTRVGPAGTTEVWVKPLADGGRAVALLNRGDAARTITTTAADVGLSGGRFTLLDAWTDDRSETSGTIRADVPAHGAALFRVSRAIKHPGAPHVVAGAPQVTAVGGTPVADDGRSPVAAAGDALRVEVAVVNDGRTDADDVHVAVGAPDGWTVQPSAPAPSSVAAGTTARFAFDVKVPAGTAPGTVQLSADTTYATSDGPRTQTGRSSLVVAPPPPSGDTVLSHHPWFTASSGWMSATVDSSVGGGSPIQVLGTTYATGIGVASPSTVGYYLGGACTRLTGVVGLDDAVRNVGPEGATAGFTVVGDGRTLFSSGTLTRDDTGTLDLDVDGVRTLYLLVDDGGDGGYNDRADWADLRAAC